MLRYAMLCYAVLYEGTDCHTFAHAIEVKNNYARNINHGEAVLAGIILATKLSIIKKVCKLQTLSEILKIYKD